jgi:hypothetical protein
MIIGESADVAEKSTYQKWIESEGIPVIKDFYIPDIRKVELSLWERIGGSGVYLNLIGTGETNNAYTREIPPGKSLKPQRHLFEEMALCSRRAGGISVWLADGEKHTFE